MDHLTKSGAICRLFVLFIDRILAIVRRGLKNVLALTGLLSVVHLGVTLVGDKRTCENIFDRGTRRHLSVHPFRKRKRKKRKFSFNALLLCLRSRWRPNV